MMSVPAFAKPLIAKKTKSSKKNGCPTKEASECLLHTTMLGVNQKLWIVTERKKKGGVGCTEFYWKEVKMPESKSVAQEKKATKKRKTKEKKTVLLDGDGDVDMKDS
jgi:hypothetical protein